MNTTSVWTVTAAVITSLGGGGLIVLALSAWLGRVWAERLMNQERQSHSQSLTKLRDELRRGTEAALEELRQEHRSQADLLTRRREIYDRLSRAMRVFLRSDRKASDEERQEFLRAYDTSYLWASDQVVALLTQFVEVNIELTRARTPQLDHMAGTLYTAAMVAMRQDAGFPDSSPQSAPYRLVTFADWDAPA